MDNSLYFIGMEMEQQAQYDGGRGLCFSIDIIGIDMCY